MADQPTPNEGRAVGVLNALKGLSFTNVLIIALMAMIAVPVYFTYRLLNDPTTLDKFLSSYDERIDEQSGCTIRKVRLRGGPWRYGVAAGFAYSGSERWQISVILHSEPSQEDIISNCAALNLIAEKMLGINGDPR